jgi:hypothetical protein
MNLYLTLTVALIAGIAFGVIWSGMLQASIDLYLARASAWSVAGLTFGRFLLSGTVLYGMALIGAGALLAAFTGFLLARTVIAGAGRRLA